MSRLVPPSGCPYACLTAFALLCCAGPDAFLGTNGNYGVFVFSIAVCVLGLYVMLSLFVAILLERFSGQDEDKFHMEDLTDRVRPELH